MSNWYVEFLKAYGDLKEVSVRGIADEVVGLFFPKDLPMYHEFITAHGRNAGLGLIAYIIYYLKIRRPSVRALDRVSFRVSEELRLIRSGFYEANSVDDLGNYRKRLPIAVKP